MDKDVHIYGSKLYWNGIRGFLVFVFVVGSAHSDIFGWSRHIVISLEWYRARDVVITYGRTSGDVVVSCVWKNNNIIIITYKMLFMCNLKKLDSHLNNKKNVWKTDKGITVPALAHQYSVIVWVRVAPDVFLTEWRQFSDINGATVTSRYFVIFFRRRIKVIVSQG